MLTTVTSLISRSGYEGEIAADFDRALARAGGSSHHLASTLIQQQNGLSFLVSHFRDRSDLEAWRASLEHREMITALETHSMRDLCIIDAPMVRIDVPSDDSGPKWKVLLSTWLAVYPLLIVLGLVLDRLAPSLPWALRLAISSLIVSVALIWVVSPVLRRITRIWRLRDQQMRSHAVPCSDA